MFGLAPRFALLLPLLGMLLVTQGCADTASGISRFVRRPFEKTTEEEFGIKTPDDRVKELRELAKAAKKKPAAEQQQLVTNLTKELQHENDAWVRRQILKTLAAFPQPESDAVLVDALSDSDIETRRTACRCLGTRGGKGAVSELTRVMSSDTDVDVRLTAIQALGQCKDRGAAGPLAEALVDPDPAVQTAVQHSLANITGRDYGNNVKAWREFAADGKTEAAEVSFAEKLRRNFY